MNTPCAVRHGGSTRINLVRRSADAGFTLIEVIVALALFALVAAAGTAMVDTVLGVEARTAGRLARLADIERAMVVITHDLTEVADEPLGGGPTGIVFARHGGRGPFAIGYVLSGAMLERIASGRRRIILDRVTAARWQFYTAGGWRDRWPSVPAQAAAWPLAVAVDLTLAGAGPRGVLRRVVALPVRPPTAGAAAKADGTAITP